MQAIVDYAGHRYQVQSTCCDGACGCLEDRGGCFEIAAAVMTHPDRLLAYGHFDGVFVDAPSDDVEKARMLAARLGLDSHKVNVPARSPWKCMQQQQLSSRL